MAAYGTAAETREKTWTPSQAGWGQTIGVSQPATGHATPGAPPAPGQPYGQPPYGYQQGSPPYGPPGAPPAAPPGSHGPSWFSGNRNGLILIGVGVALLLVVALGLTLFAANRDSGYEIGACVKKGPSNSVLEAGCEEPGAYRIVKKVDREDQCGKPDEPTITLESGGKREVFCLEKATR